ncbi:MAG: PASTA domain-containing protein [Candidatus Firestonebacteria bacterium]|nr:PASTA domain-containing protein [Candidatus Firestonebacteria bacterium]
MEYLNKIKEILKRYIIREHIIGMIISMFLVASLLIGIVLWIFSIGVEVIETPSVIGLDALGALEVLTPKGLGLKIEGQVYNNKYPKGYIVSQNPEQKQNVRKNRDVQVVISKGTEKVKIPNLMGLPVRQAKVFIQQVGLIKGDEAYVESDKIPQNRVLAQSPPPGMLVNRETKVNVLVSLGALKKTYLMPDCIGKKLSIVERGFNEVSIIIGEVKYEYNPDFQEGTIISQTPEFSTPVKQGEKVKFKITRSSLYKEKNKLTRYILLYYIPPVGALKKDVRILIDEKDDSAVEEVFSGKVSPGDKIQLVVRVNSNNSVAKIYLDDELIEEKDL